MKNEEQKRLDEHYSKEKDWLKWGPYLSERQWGTVREDYSPNGTAWEYFPHDHARSRAYRWGEDGIAGISDRYCNICFAIAQWNGKDPIIKERLFGLTGNQGNHGEDVKELYFPLDNTPTHSYMRYLYKYPHNPYPYTDLIAENGKRGRKDLEYEILDTGVFDNNAYFDVTTEYAKADNDDLLIRITVSNRGLEKAALSLLPTLWIRNFWSFVDMPEKPSIALQDNDGAPYVSVRHVWAGNYNLYFESAPKLLFTENETNFERVFGSRNDHPFKKDLFHTALTQGDFSLAMERREGTKFAPLYQWDLESGEQATVRLRLSAAKHEDPFDAYFDKVFREQVQNSEAFYESLLGTRNIGHFEIQKQALSRLLWSKQYYNYDVETWLIGDPKEPLPPVERLGGRNHTWKTLRSHDIMLMPDKWEYPWYAAWDSSFHCVTMALLDSRFAKEQLLLFTKEWYMAPNGQIPAYEWSFSDVNPPVQAWAALQIYQYEKNKSGTGDLNFLKRMFNKLALNFTWWVNRLDSRENNVFEGGFLGLDNIGVFDRSHGIPGNGILEQVDGTAWMAMFCLNMLEISLELAIDDEAYEDMANKYLGHFVFIAEALNKMNMEYEGTWDQEQGFFYDKLIFPDGRYTPIKVRSIAGMLSLTAVLCVKAETLEQLPRFKKSLGWFKKHRMETLKYPVIQEFTNDGDLLLSLVPKDRVQVLVRTLLDENEFLGPYGLRSLSKVHETPYTIAIDGTRYSIGYEPGESATPLFGGNSNWRGPIWFPLNYTFIHSLREYHSYYGDTLQFDFPTGSDNPMNLAQVSTELSARLIRIFEKDEHGDRPVNSLYRDWYRDARFEDLILFHEYFHGDTGRGVGASHQTGWTALVANLIQELS
ncbi:MGH1-like glycoside hydrolase domain-containing protein [Flagellimonas beolgyonensis]|uniref:MGH1-like glycoside hydrolase domain-containing protein n=1 Tax=Flagellimonas beolgyonensis TaxID=864064 RepID=UPI003D658C38